MKVLLSNDDGVNAPGIRALYKELHAAHEATIIAPLEERSTTGHSLSLDKPLRLERLDENIYGCSGFPGDCVLMGIGYLLKERRPEVIVSGINRGANLGQDLYYSGTIAAAREAAFHGIPSIAVSLVFESMHEVHRYETAATFIKWCLELEIHKHCPPLTVININVPNLPIEEIKGARLTQVGFRRYTEEIHARVDIRQRDYYWIAGVYQGFEKHPDSDCQAVDEGLISITPQVLISGQNHDHTGLREVIRKLNAKLNS